MTLPSVLVLSTDPLAAALVAAAVVLRWLWPRLGSMRIPVIGYVAVITAMVLGGVAVRNASLLATAGAIAFYASDLAVARDKFVVKDVWNRAIGLPLYYGAQLLIAWSVVAGR